MPITEYEYINLKKVSYLGASLGGITLGGIGFIKGLAEGAFEDTEGAFQMALAGVLFWESWNTFWDHWNDPWTIKSRG